MGVINLELSEKTALKEIDERELATLIEQATKEERISALYRLPLSDCGSYVASKFQQFDRALREYNGSKSAKKRGETHYRAMRAGSDLSAAVQQMRERVEVEEREGQLFYVEDRLLWPSSFSENLDVTVRYRWRKIVDDPWKWGRVAFKYLYRPRMEFDQPRPARKPTAFRQAQQRQDNLAREWEQLKDRALHSVKRFLREGGDPEAIPEQFEVRADRGYLNNFSADFWRDEKDRGS